MERTVKTYGKAAIIGQLKQDILLLEGFKPESGESPLRFGLGPLEKVFPYGIFPVAAIHEFLCDRDEQFSACKGFLSVLLAVLMQEQKACIWISPFPQVFPAALSSFGLSPDRIIFIQLRRDRDILWAMEEALKCSGVAAVVAELQDLSFAASRRLQLAVERSRVTGFVLRRNSRKINTTACVARWRISPLPSKLNGEMPGVGFPQWRTELLKVKNGQADTWNITWTPQGLAVTNDKQNLIPTLRKIIERDKTAS